MRGTTLTAAAALGLLLAGVGCESTPPQGLGDPTVLEKVAGDAQSDTAGAVLGQPLVVGAVSRIGRVPREDVTVHWSVLSPAGGSLSALQTTTDSTGITGVLAKLPDARSDTTMVVEAALSGGADRVVFTLGVEAGGGGGETGGARAAQIQRVSGNDQKGMKNDTLPDPLRVSVADEEGVAVAGAAVRWKVTSDDGGSVLHGRTLTDSSGVATNRWRVGTRGNTTDRVLAWIRDAGGDTVSVRFTADVTGHPDTIRVDQGALELDNNATPEPEEIVGDTVTVAPGFWSRKPFKATVVDSFGSSVPGAELSWTVTSGGGTVGDEADGAGSETVTVNTAEDGSVTVWRRAPSGATEGDWIGATLSLENFPEVEPVTLDALVRP